MRRIRSHLTFANVVSVIALFVALGGTAVGAVIINNNSQVARNTISGHHPPPRQHANIIAGSVNGTDLSEGIKSSLTLHCPAGMQRAFPADLCFEFSARSPDTLPNALRTCANAQRRLPDAGELALVFDHLGAPQNAQWVATHYVDYGTPNPIQLGAVQGQDSSRNITMDAFLASSHFPYRCVASPTN
jgi:hypothetical protein